MSDREMGVFFILALIGFIVFLISDSPKPPTPDPDPDTQRNFARQILMKKTTPEDIVKDKGYDLEHVKKWKDDYVNWAVEYALQAPQRTNHINLMYEDLVCLRKICHKYIGPDWEEKTGFVFHEITQFSDENN